MMTRRRKRRPARKRSSAWMWVWIALAVMLVVGLVLRRAPGEGGPMVQVASASGTEAKAAAGSDDAEAEADAGTEADAGAGADAAWLAKLRRPDRREAFLDAADELAARWEERPEAHPLIEKLLTMPQYSASAVWRFVGQDLLRTDDEEQMLRLTRWFVQFGGEGYPAGLRIELRGYIERNPALATASHRRILEVIGDEELAVEEDARIAVPAVEQHTLAQLIDRLPAELGEPYEQAMADMLDDMAGLTHDVYHPIDRAIGETHDYVALACARYLWDRAEHEASIRRYLENRLDRSALYGAAIREMLEKLNER